MKLNTKQLTNQTLELIKADIDTKKATLIALKNTITNFTKEHKTNEEIVRLADEFATAINEALDTHDKVVGGLVREIAKRKSK